MFTGIIRGIGKVLKAESLTGLTRLTVSIDSDHLAGLKIGASISIDGVCLTVVAFTQDTVSFDVIRETLTKTNLKLVKEGDFVNFERAARFGDEIGGHVLSGHIFGTALVDAIDRSENNCKISLKCPVEWTKYLIPKGYVALNGASLTLVDVDQSNGHFSVHLIPETLQKTTFGIKKPSDCINIEFETQTQTIVDTVERLHKVKV